MDTSWLPDNVIIATQEVIEGVMGALMREDQEEAPNSISESAHWTLEWTAQSCLTRCDPMCCTPLGSYVLVIFQATILDQFAIYFSKGSSQGLNPTFTHLSCFGRWILYLLLPMTLFLEVYK